MIVLTADQVDSRSTADAVPSAIDDLNTTFGGRLALDADRTAGDELQLMLDSGSTALQIALHLSRSERWSVGLGVGSVREPIGANIRESTGEAFIAARSAVERAKSASTRFAIECPTDAAAAADLEALINLLLSIRGRRSAQGWELYELVRTGMTQAEAALRLGITPQAVSKRARAAELRNEFAAVSALERLADKLNAAAPSTEETPA